MKVFDVLTNEEKLSVTSNLETLLVDESDTLAIAKQSLNFIAHYTTDGSYLQSFFFLKAFAEKTLEAIAQNSESQSNK